MLSKVKLHKVTESVMVLNLRHENESSRFLGKMKPAQVRHQSIPTISLLAYLSFALLDAVPFRKLYPERQADELA